MMKLLKKKIHSSSKMYYSITNTDRKIIQIEIEGGKVGKIGRYIKYKCKKKSNRKIIGSIKNIQKKERDRQI